MAVWSEATAPSCYDHTFTVPFQPLYPLFYTPLPNSRWLHNMALRYVPRVQLGAYMWRRG